MQISATRYRGICPACAARSN